MQVASVLAPLVAFHITRLLMIMHKQKLKVVKRLRFYTDSGQPYVTGRARDIEHIGNLAAST